MSELGVRLQGDIAVIDVPAELQAEKADEVLMWLKEFKDPSVKQIVFDFKSCRQIHLNVYPIFGRIKMEFNRQGLQYHSVGMEERLTSRLASDGVNGLFAIKRGSAASGSSAAGGPRPSFSVENLNLMIEQLGRALRSSNVEAQCGKPFLKAQPVFQGVGVIGIMPLSSPQMKGTIRVSAPQEFAILLHKDLFGQDVTEASDEAIEILEEITAVFFMYLREKLKDKGIELMNAAPSVLVGLPANVQQTETAQTMVLPFTSNYGSIFLEVVLA